MGTVIAWDMSEGGIGDGVKVMARMEVFSNEVIWGAECESVGGVYQLMSN